jgi:hypothetical protein
MSRVARAARVASRQRVETITATKTIGSAETGELYLVDNAAGSIVITLPALQDGAYFKFLISKDCTDFNTKPITIQSAASGVANGELVGSCLIVLDGGSTAMGTHQLATQGDNHPQFIIESTHAADDLFVGSSVDVYCDGTRWYVKAELRTNQARLIGKFHGS